MVDRVSVKAVPRVTLVVEVVVKMEAAGAEAPYLAPVACLRLSLIPVRW